jgi:murein DD-endopeptidase MepM/ murein hydrolase activator NlpD
MRDQRLGRRGRGGGILRTLRILLSLAVAGLLGLVLLRVGSPPRLSVEPTLPGIGPRTPIVVEVKGGGRGLGDVRVEVVQGELVSVVARREHEPRPFWAFWGPRTVEDRFEVEVGFETVPELAEGPATVRVLAERAGTWLRHPDPAVVDTVLPVIVRPPSLAVTSSLHYATQGGSEAVVYHVGPSAERDGVRAGSAWFPGYPLPGGGEGERFCLFAVPFDLAEAAEVRLVVADAVGNELAEPFLDRFTERPPTPGTIRLDDDFMARVVPGILSRSRGQIDEGETLLDSYLTINGELRRINAQQLAELAAGSPSSFLWSRPFVQQPNSQVMSPFAVRRTYVYDGEEVDRQVHLGFDLASYRHAEVPAANRGVVAMAVFLGIYGNAVVIDHGYGLMSLYAHLSSIDVAVGDEVERGESVGRTGRTGLAGGDHLHFSILLHGVPVTPVEWWDGKWIEDHVAYKLGDALAFER